MRTQGNLPEAIYVRRVGEYQSWLAEGRLAVDADLMQLLRDVLDAVVSAGETPPSVDELAAIHGKDVIAILKLLAKRGDLVAVAADRYFGFVGSLMLVFGLATEYPILLVFLSRVGLLTSAKLRRWRRNAVVLAVVVGVLAEMVALASANVGAVKL